MTNFDKMYELLVAQGMQQKIAKLFIKKFKIEEDSYCCSDQDREWTMSRGFFPSRKELFNLNDDNYKFYLSDYVDFMLHPYNNHFAIWINDKLTLRYTLGRDFADIMPKYYLYVENNGDYTYLWDAPDNISKDEDFIYNLLREKKCLIIKPNSSTSGGEGVMKIEWDNEKICINNKDIVTKESFQKRIKSLGNNNIITEYAHQHTELNRIWSASECTLRIIMIKLPRQFFYSKSNWKCIVSFARFGASISGGASNLSSGGIGIGFDFETGMFNSSGIRYKEYCPDGIWQCYEHPDTHVVWENEKLPNWDYVRNTLYKVCDHYGSLSHLGFDVIITQNGFVFCEINSKPALNYEQVMCGPLLTSTDNVNYFEHKGMNDIESSAFYSIWKNSQM